MLGLDNKTPSEKGAANAAVRVLNELVVDPDNVTHKVPRLSLYERYRDSYNACKLEMENEIEEKRTSVGMLDYQLWFLWYSNRHRNSYLLCNHLLLCNTGIIIVCGLLSLYKS